MRSKFVSVLAGLALCFTFSSQSSEAKTITGWASYYKHGKRTANGERFNPNGMTAAHRKLPFGTKVKVTNLKTGQSIVVRINDRGPFIKNRVIDLSYGAARVVGLHRSGVAKVSFFVVQ